MRRRHPHCFLPSAFCILLSVLRLPATLERRLAEIFPKIRDREQFVKETLEEALSKYEPQVDESESTISVGGTLHLFSDGGSRGNPGQAAIGWIIEDPIRGEVLKEGNERIGVETNNVAEYQALIAGLKAAEQFHPNRLVCHLDSELVVKQLNGEYKVKMPALQVFFDEIKRLADELPDVVFTHIPREDNYRADALVNRALDEMPAPKFNANKPDVPQQNLFAQRPIPSERPGDLYRQSVRRPV